MKTIQHQNPIWREKTNFIIGSKVISNSSKEIWEQLWSRKISENTFEICCIPFFLYNINLGDRVKTDQDLWILRVIKHSGHFTFRVWFGQSSNTNIRKEIIEKVTMSGFLFEWYSNNLLAIDTPTEILAKQMADYLFEKDRLGEITYETGRK